MTNTNQKLVPPFSQKDIDELTPEDIKRGCLTYRLEVNDEACALENYGKKTDWRFCLYPRKEKRIDAPTLPLKIYDKIWHKGWDIPTLFAIDANNKCWMNNAHGGYLYECSSNDLINNMEDEPERNAIRVLLGEKENLTTVCPCCSGTGYINISDCE